jgi:hypothetical protein
MQSLRVMCFPQCAHSSKSNNLKIFYCILLSLMRINMNNPIEPVQWDIRSGQGRINPKEKESAVAWVLSFPSWLRPSNFSKRQLYPSTSLEIIDETNISLGNSITCEDEKTSHVRFFLFVRSNYLSTVLI